MDNSAYIFHDDKDRPKVLYKYKESLDNYIRVANHICSKELHKSRVRFLPYLYYKEDIKVDDLATNGRAFMRLEDSYREVKAYYREKWSYQSLK
ncbi:hypothetical protein [Photobacterium leiognathi]|uniref:hypothetical protein n=1 Tax=Photobacterium leiognathi TaxID=553611 RepID=UPI002982B1A7|nr:hypothetical protein [Photobacterium leiognathi]